MIKRIRGKFAYILYKYGKWIPDEQYLKFLWRLKMHSKLDLSNPKTYNEKLQWLKLYDRKPIYTKMVDKYEVKKYVSATIGKEYVIPTYGVWNNFEDINFAVLPNQFVLKCTHDSGGVIICKDKSQFDVELARKIMNKSLMTNFFFSGREWPYKNVMPRIIAEKYIESDTEDELKDYKFFVFNGECRLMFIASDRQNKNEETKFDFFDMDFNWLPIENGHPRSKIPPKKPRCFELMKKLSEQLGKDIPHVRVDFYEVNGRVFFGELTLFHWSGLIPFKPKEWDDKMGEWLKLPQ